MSDGRPVVPPVALITGGTRRLGKSIATHLAKSGWRLVLTYQSDAVAARETQEELGQWSDHVRLVQSVSGSAADAAQLLEGVQHHEGRLDFLLHNVGRYVAQDPLTLSPADWDATIAMNLNAGYYYAHYGRVLLERSRGLLGFMGFTGLASFRADTETMDYSVSKVGLLSLVRSLAVAFGPSGVRVAMVSPGQMHNSVDLPDDVETIPLARFGMPEDLNQAWDFLLASDYVTGVNIEVAGGFRL